ncbi:MULTISPECIES: hypothetical protein [Klebsiella pneumoniae complex]|uniref:hypothetical protein n=1 Tax=Klebsiella pneumoniae complex TaxID=3390273 RepID=UPI000D741BA0|nr:MULTISPECIES: hypothetical protein [Klebsiella]MDU4798159.1 hypothetical protein [Klebsiella michiganensis]EKP0841986.1 hypothetical protein [Klebsiella pneumoniae]EKV8555584.1 hypothetical protein [Klebsiella pneumoniae]EKZ9639187.1 hypothetical protein [Klebsiella pneumoniae]ELA0849235.1 hypothetical protein [Klebsiella pneumoniae]
MGSYIADYQATKNGQVIYSGTLAIESDGTDVAIKEAVMAELNAINAKFGGGIPDAVTVNSWSAE